MPQFRAALRATESVSRVLSGFLPAVGRPISDEEFKWQTGERIAVLEVVENRLKKPAPTALVRQIRSVLRGSRPHTKDNPVAEKIGRILSEIPQSDDLMIFDAFSTGQVSRRPAARGWPGGTCKRRGSVRN